MGGFIVYTYFLILYGTYLEKNRFQSFDDILHNRISDTKLLSQRCENKTFLSKFTLYLVKMKTVIPLN